MHTETWVPNTNPQLDSLFEELRSKQHSDTSHPLYHNYAKDNFVDVLALSILFDDDNEPLSVGSILQRDCWPSKACRILNRFWKVNDKRLKVLSRVTPAVSEMIRSQHEYVKQNTDFELVFMSRQYDNWQKFTVHSLSKHYGLEFNYDHYKYLTWTDESQETSWQNIIYSGNEKLLEQWKRR
jgi:hypothetical protein